VAAVIRVASYNIHKCVGTDRRRDPARIIDVLAEVDADIVALQEADLRFGEKAGLLDLVTLQGRLGLVPVVVQGAGKNHGWHGNVLLVREAVVHESHQIRLPGAVRSWLTWKRSHCTCASSQRILVC
jgi:endonuclease/exonuclease/phosphatase family metal-dependent hydrolase